MRFTLRLNGSKSPATFLPVSHEGELTAELVCPRCHAAVRIADHVIAADGVVSPHFACPQPDCGFFDFIVLDRWYEVVTARCRHEDGPGRAAPSQTG